MQSKCTGVISKHNTKRVWSIHFKKYHKLRLQCSAKLANSCVQIGKSQNDDSWWLINDSVENVELSARELYGFNVGSFCEVPSGCFSRNKNIYCNVYIV